MGAAALLQGMTAHYLATDTYPLKAGDTYQFSGQTLMHDALIGKPDGTMVTLSGGKKMLALPKGPWINGAPPI